MILTKNIKHLTNRYLKQKLIIRAATLSLITLLAVVGVSVIKTAPLVEAACSPTGTTYGTDTMTVSVPTTTTYNVWVRMQAPVSTSNSIMLEVDGGSCFNVGGSSSMPLNTWTWVNYQNGSSSQVMQSSLTSTSAHSLKLIGTQPGVAIDNILLLNDPGCVPTGTGTNCTTNQSDTTKPTVALTAPASGATVSGTTTLSANAADNVAVASVQFQLDGNNLGAADTTSPYTYSWNTSTASNGSHTLAAIATDSSGNTASSSETITVSNTQTDTTPPTVSLTAPASGATVTGNASISANAADNVAVASVQFKLDGSNLGSAITTSPYGFAWNTANVANGSHTLTAVATDTSGNSTTSGSVTVNVSNVAADVAPTAPPNLQAGAIGTGSVALSWGASTDTDSSPVAGYRVWRGDANYANWILVATLPSPSSLAYTDTSVSPGTGYTYGIRAFDTAGLISAGSNTVKITTLAGDTSPPTVTITSPTAGQTVKGSVSIAANASDNVGVTKVQFFVDGASANTVTTSPYAYSWDTTTIADGTHILDATAYDAAGNANNSEVTVTVQNGDNQAPTVPTNVAATADSYKSVTLNWTGSTDNVGVAGYYIIRDGTTVGQVDGTTTTYTDGTVSAASTYSYTVEAFDAAGNVSAPSIASSIATPNPPDTTPPSAPTSLSATPVSSSQINLSWSGASDNVGVTSYIIFRGIGSGSLTQLATVSTTSYGDTGLSANTAYSYYVIAVDSAGNRSLPSVTKSASTLPVATTTAAVEGTVTSASTHQPLAGVYVHTGIYGTTSGMATAYTNSAGQYVLTNITPDKRHSYYFSDNGYKTKGLALKAPVGITILNVSLTPL